jgi:hypothetical protein
VRSITLYAGKGSVGIINLENNFQINVLDSTYMISEKVVLESGGTGK